MDMIKIGAFIASVRKEKGLTQMQLAEKLWITDRAVSKWERGLSMPDSSIMLDLCEILNISVNELLKGEKIEMENEKREAENNLIELLKQKEEADKILLNMEILVGIIAIILLPVLILIPYLIDMPMWLKIVLVCLGIIVFMFACLMAIRIEQKAGYYECKHCGNKYVPTYPQVLFAMHINRTRYMKCPKCQKKSWNKKIISK